MYRMRDVHHFELPALTLIDRRCFKHDPWGPVEFSSIKKSEEDVIRVAVDCHNTILGYVAFRITAKRFELLRVAVHPHHQRGGVGRFMLEYVMRLLADSDRQRAGAWVPDVFLPVVHLWLKACGWRMTRRMPARKSGLGDDCSRFVFDAVAVAA